MFSDIIFTCFHLFFDDYFKKIIIQIYRIIKNKILDIKIILKILKIGLKY